MNTYERVMSGPVFHCETIVTDTVLTLPCNTCLNCDPMTPQCPCTFAQVNPICTLIVSHSANNVITIITKEKRFEYCGVTYLLFMESPARVLGASRERPWRVQGESRKNPGTIQGASRDRQWKV